MSLFDTTGICPYTGLRSFTEEESLYFKGRDLQVDQITALLEQNRFLMVTGASGEGKSSLIYAGLVPNARAGFFRAKYTNWAVADFRPERSPVKNMALAVAATFDAQPATIETELRRGFSSLIDLYTNSDFYTNEEDEQWKGFSEEVKKDKRRKGANLLILADQFEEFFTNPENFLNDVPSQESQIVVNLILETARIAIKKNLPVYIVCTMRSDYIGQCSAFRGLPEYIGFSQFFVPRLKRKDLKQVIEEPAILSGNKISQRLIERLVYDLAEGVDQLPILQHALNQIWLSANHGRDEMDLLHYAKVGGMPAEELPDHDRIAFEQWFATVPEQQRSYYETTGLGKVIEIHASVLYENAGSYYNRLHPEKPISQELGKRIVEIAFACLTKIDDGRAVRNRMNLAEITAIVNDPSVSTEVVAGVLDVYREEGNSFIRPFKTDDKNTHNLRPETVLDITHESLIRNWTKLTKWANEEYAFYATYLDFKKQLLRWTNSGKSNAYLLPIGPLSYFEGWYARRKPNAGWITRYADVKEENVLAAAENELDHIQEFLKRSGRSVAVTRAFVKYGPQRLAAIVAGIVMLIASGFYWYDAEQKKNDRVLDRVVAQSKKLLTSVEVKGDARVTSLFMQERYEPGSLMKQLRILSAKDRLSESILVYRSLLETDKKNKTALKDTLVSEIDRMFAIVKGQQKDYDVILKEANKFCVALAFDNYYNPSDRTVAFLKRTTETGYDLVVKFFSDRTLMRPTVAIELNVAIQYWLTFNQSAEGVANMLAHLSPIAGDVGKSNFDLYYPKGSYESNGRAAVDFSGGYHTLACLYAAAGDEKSVLWCFDQLVANGQKDYFGNGRLLNNYTGVIAYLYQFGHGHKAPALLDWLGKNDKEDTPYAIYRNMVIRSAYISRLFNNAFDPNSLRSFKGYFFPTLCLAKHSFYEDITVDFNKQLEKTINADERNFLLAMSRKRQAIYEWQYRHDRDLPIDSTVINRWFDEAFVFYRQVSSNYLKEQITITIPYATDGVRQKTLTRKELFIYPDYMDGWFSNSFHSEIFFNYLYHKKLLKELYVSADDLEMLQWWLAKAFDRWPFFFASDKFVNIHELPTDVLVKMAAFIERHSEKNQFDGNLLNLVIANRYYGMNDPGNAATYSQRVHKETVNESAERYGYIERGFFYNELRRWSVAQARLGNKDVAMEVAEKFPRENERAFAYLFMAEGLYGDDTNPEAFLYLDSALSKINKLDISTLPPQIDPRFEFIRFASKIGSKPMDDIAFSLLRDYPGDYKRYVFLHLVDGFAAEGNYYQAYAAMPSTLTETSELECLNAILWEACKKKEIEERNTEWEPFDKQMLVTKVWSYLQYFLPF